MSKITIVKTKSSNKDVFAIGDTVQALDDVHFIHGPPHRKGEFFKITEDTLAYFNTPFNAVHYRKVKG